LRTHGPLDCPAEQRQRPRASVRSGGEREGNDGIARRIEQISGYQLQLNQGTIYPALLHLEQMGWISSKWGVSENNRRAKYYSITRAGKKQLAAEEEGWRRASEIMIRFLEPSEENT
jgi:transcriptional regulator